MQLFLSVWWRQFIFWCCFFMIYQKWSLCCRHHSTNAAKQVLWTSSNMMSFCQQTDFLSVCLSAFGSGIVKTFTVFLFQCFFTWFCFYQIPHSALWTRWNQNKVLWKWQKAGFCRWIKLHSALEGSRNDHILIMFSFTGLMPPIRSHMPHWCSTTSWVK